MVAEVGARRVRRRSLAGRRPRPARPRRGALQEGGAMGRPRRPAGAGRGRLRRGPRDRQEVAGLRPPARSPPRVAPGGSGLRGRGPQPPPPARRDARLPNAGIREAGVGTEGGGLGEVAEVDGNRTRRCGVAAASRFEGGGAHQALGHLRGEPTLEAMDRRPPSVDSVARELSDSGLPHALLVEIARRAVAAVEPAEVAAAAARDARRAARALIQPVVNATGVLLHTNLGRAPLGAHRDAGYTNVELDLESGGRGDRSAHAARLAALACGAEAALVVNNGAAAVLLALAATAAGREVLVSRGELVEIGGGFRVPEVLAASGARLVEVGTTNRTRLADYSARLGADTALALKVHTSNYKITGFTEAVPVADLAGLGVPVVADLGSGLLDARCPWIPGGPPPWLVGEPAARQTLEAGGRTSGDP